MKVRPEKSNQTSTGIADVLFWQTLNGVTPPRNAPRTGSNDEGGRSAMARFNLLPSDYFYVLQCNFDNLIFVRNEGRQLIINRIAPGLHQNRGRTTP
jgi:hypothetical protein